MIRRELQQLCISGLGLFESRDRTVGQSQVEQGARGGRLLGQPLELFHGFFFFRNLARGQITGKTAGMLKLLFHRETLEVLGIHCFGQNAAEILHIGQAIMYQSGENNTIKYFINTTFNYPTMAEAYRVAALYGRNRTR